MSTVCTTFDEVQVMVGTCWCASALVFRLVLMYTTWRGREGPWSGKGGHLAPHATSQLVPALARLQLYQDIVTQDTVTGWRQPTSGITPSYTQPPSQAPLTCRELGVAPASDRYDS